jgi:hypothetical protein
MVTVVDHPQPRLMAREWPGRLTRSGAASGGGRGSLMTVRGDLGVHVWVCRFCLAQVLGGGNLGYCSVSVSTWSMRA